MNASEEWEHAIQAIQNLSPRTFLVKVQRRGTAQVRTISIPSSRVSEAELEQVRSFLLAGRSMPDERAATNVQTQATVEFTVTAYEPVAQRRRIRVLP